MSTEQKKLMSPQSTNTSPEDAAATVLLHVNFLGFYAIIPAALIFILNMRIITRYGIKTSFSAAKFAVANRCFDILMVYFLQHYAACGKGRKKSFESRSIEPQQQSSRKTPKIRLQYIWWEYLGSFSYQTRPETRQMLTIRYNEYFVSGLHIFCISFSCDTLGHRQCLGWDAFLVFKIKSSAKVMLEKLTDNFVFQLWVWRKPSLWDWLLKWRIWWEFSTAASTSLFTQSRRSCEETSTEKSRKE